MIAIFMFIILIVFVLLGAPISMAMAIGALAAIKYSGLDPVIIPSLISGGMSNYTLMAIPFFIFLGNIMNSGGITERIFDWCEALVGHMKGSLAQVNVVTSVVFAAISGTAVANAAGLGMLGVKAMRSKGYDGKFSTGVTVAASLLGLILAAALMAQIYFMCATGKVQCPEPEKFSLKKLITATKRSIFALLCPVLLFLGVGTGVATATEVGILGCVYAIFVSIIYKTFSLKNLIDALKKTITSASSIMFLTGVGSVIAWVMTKEQVPQTITNALVGFTSSKYVVLLIILFILLFLGCFMDGTSIQLVMVPVLMPIAAAFGIDMIHLGVVVALAVTIGASTPPVGVCLFVLSTVTGEPLENVIAGTKTFYLPIFIALLFVTFFPPIVTWLPNLLLGA